MVLFALSQATSNGSAGQVLTFALPIGVFSAIVFWGFFQRGKIH